MKLIVAILACSVTVAGCSGGGNSVESLDALEQMLRDAGVDCEGLEADSEELFVREGGSCESELGDLSVYVFNDSDNRDTYLEVAEGFGGGPYVVGSNWLIEVRDLSTAEELASDLDASVE